MQVSKHPSRFLALLGLIAAALILAGIARFMRQQQDASSWVAHTVDVLLRAADLQLQMQTAISEARGYRLNRDEEGLTRFHEAASRAAEDEALLRSMTVDNPRQQETLGRLHGLIAHRLSVVRGNAGVPPSASGQSDVRASPAEAAALMAQVTACIEAMEAEETRLLAQRRAAVALARERTGIGVTLAGALLSASLAAALALMARAQRERAHGAELARLNQELNQRVAERTQEYARAAALLRDGEARQRRILDHAPFAMAILTQRDDGHYAYEYMNLACLETYGRPPADFVGRTVEEVWPAPLAAIITARLAACAGNEPLPFAIEHQLDGRARALDGALAPLREEGSGPRQILACALDVTIRRETERALSRERERLANLIAATGVGTWELDVASGEMLVNARYCEMFGWDHQTVPGFHEAVDWVHPDEVAVTREKLRQLMDGACDHYEHERRIRHRQGHYVWVLSRARVMARLPDGSPEWIIGALQDISARKQQEAALRKSEEFLERTGRCAGIGGWELDVASGRLEWSPETGRIHGLAPGYLPSLAEGIGFYAPEARDVISAAVETCMADGTGWDLELPFIPADGKRIWVRTVGSAVMQDGRAVRLTGAFQDVTHSVLQRLALQDRAVELQHSNAELDRLARHMDRARKDAEQASRAKTRFLAGMSHELRTPLNGILGYAQLLRMDGGLTPLQAQRVHAMLRAGTHLLDMISCVLDLSEIETQSVEPQCSKLDVIELAEACVAILRPQAEAKGLSIGLSVQAGLPRHIMGDAPRLRQVLLNLLGNAVKYTSAGSVALRVGVAEAGDPSEGERLRFDVRDTGPGIPPEKRYRLFEEFERLGAGGAGGQEGAGLGLYLAKRLTALLRGTIGHDDNPGGGSVFWLTLPLVVCGEQRDAAGAAPDDGAGDDRCGADGGGQLPILVVDDVAINRDIAASFIRSAGHVVVCAADGAQAVEMAASGAYRLIFMDVRMPGIDGLEATRRIRALDGPAADVPIVALTAQAFTEQIEACRQAGMDTHLAKPFTLETLLGAIDRGVEAGRRRARAQKPALLGSDLPVLNAASYALTASCLSPAMMATYVNGVVGQITALQSRLAGGAADDAESLAEAAHVLAGSAGMFGCERLVFVAKHFEASIMADPGQAAILSDGLQGALSATVPAMRGRLEAA